MSETRVIYEGGLRCRAEHGETDAVVFTDAPKDHHGQGATFSPSEMLSVSLGSCILSMMAVTARTLGVAMEGASASVSKRMGNAPRRIVELAVDVHIPGHVDTAQRHRLEAAAHACPVHQVLAIDAPIRLRWDEDHVRDGDAPAAATASA